MPAAAAAASWLLPPRRFAMNRLRWWLVSGAGIPWSLRIGTRVSSTHPTGQRACRLPANFIVAGQSWALLQRELGWVAGAASGEPSDDEKRLGRGIAGGLLHLDDPERLRWLVDQLQRHLVPDPAGFDPATERSWRMLMAQLWGSGRQYVPQAEALVRLWAAADLRAELVELFALLLGGGVRRVWAVE